MNVHGGLSHTWPLWGFNSCWPSFLPQPQPTTGVAEWGGSERVWTIGNVHFPLIFTLKP